MHKFTPSIGSLQLDNPLILAPMAGITSLPYRRIMKSFGAALVFTEMISANGLIRDGRKTFELLHSCQEEAPLGVQLFGDEPEILAQGAAMIADARVGALLDINMGCPVKKVIRSGAGSALLKEPRRVAQILSAVRAAYRGPLTIKIRSGWDSDSLNYIEIGRIAESEGVDAITLHPRTRSQAFSGKADWRQIGELKAELKIPIFGSGDIFTAEDGLNMLRQTACDGLMIGRGAYGNPWLFRDILTQLKGGESIPPTAAEKLEIAIQHLEFYREQFGDHKTILEMRKHLCWYARGLPGASQFRASLQQVSGMEHLMTTTHNFFNAADCA
jgi:hypothetical protein